VREIKYHNGETIKVDGLHFYGCSYVAGQELMDEEMPDPMGIPLKDMQKQKGETVESYYKRKLSRELLFKKKMKLENQLSWPQHMCNTLKVRSYNHGVHGASMTFMKAKILSHIMGEEYEIDKDKEAIVIGLTGFAREMIFAENENFYFELGRYGSARSLVVATDFERRGDPDFARKYLSLKGVYTLFWHFLHEIYNIINLCKTYDIKFYIIPMLDVFNIKWYKKQYEIDFERPMFASQIKFLESEIDKYIIEGTKLDPLGSNIIERLPRGHPCAESHKLYGKKVGEKLLT
tara:strand:+ start:150 stop:1022 length:873 start_codon:yes stop_codon:yes gene_type:complete